MSGVWISAVCSRVFWEVEGKLNKEHYKNLLENWSPMSNYM